MTSLEQVEHLLQEVIDRINWCNTQSGDDVVAAALFCEAREALRSALDAVQRLPDDVEASAVSAVDQG